MAEVDPSPRDAARRRWKIDEDWASVVVGLTLLLLVLAEVIVGAWVP